MLVLSHGDVRRLLDGAEHEVLRAVRAAYVLHAEGRTAVPHSVFLRFPGDERNRIIALPAYLDTPVAGVKWVSSFPGNVATGLDRASAAIILNSMRTGRPEAFLEGATISARRTAASAALAATTLGAPGTGVTLVGCGVINFEVLAFLRAVRPELDTVTVFDLDEARMRTFADRCATRWPELKVDLAARVEDAMAAHQLVCLATSAAVPHLDGTHCRPGTLVLHLSLRDLTPETILSSVNIVDDADHVCRAATSLHLTEQRVGHRDFIAGSLGDLLRADGRYERNVESLTVFSPFGLGALDIAVADLVHRGARELGLGTPVPDFLG